MSQWLDCISIKTICEVRNFAAPHFPVVSFRHKGIRQHSVLEQLGLRSSLNILNMRRVNFVFVLRVVMFIS